MTTGFDLDEIERLLAAASGSGVWALRRVMDKTFRVRTEAGTFVASSTYEQDAALIVAARNSLPAILTEIRELRAENARLKKLTIPTWFYHPDYPEYCKFDPSEVIDEDYDPLPGDHVFEIDCAVALPSIWCAVHVSNDPDDDERFTYTEHASEAEARAALGEPQ